MPGFPQTFKNIFICLLSILYVYKRHLDYIAPSSLSPSQHCNRQPPNTITPTLRSSLIFNNPPSTIHQVQLGLSSHPLLWSTLPEYVKPTSVATLLKKKLTVGGVWESLLHMQS